MEPGQDLRIVQHGDFRKGVGQKIDDLCGLAREGVQRVAPVAARRVGSVEQDPLYAAGLIG